MFNIFFIATDFVWLRGFVRLVVFALFLQSHFSCFILISMSILRLDAILIYFLEKIINFLEQNEMK
jgi:hypothetical protein